MDYLIDASGISMKVPLPGRESLQVVDQVDLRIEAGQSYSIVGRSGSGKTSLLSILGLLNADYSGSLLMSGVDVSSLTDRRLSVLRAKQIGFVFQSYSLIPHLTALDNVLLPCVHAGLRRREGLARARQALDEVGLGDRLSAKPAQLSGGEQQRVAIARAIVNHPQVVMADEPTGALDTDTGDSVIEILMERVPQNKIALIIVTHDADVAGLCSQHYFMQRGQLSKMGSLAHSDHVAPIANAEGS
ncbi:MAG: ABC transporter ATP-binding protein [Propionibacteriaceae bacterium]|nr:ABC transporter ATP-binding protein [Propionibacteriaceae bacterium]